MTPTRLIQLRAHASRGHHFTNAMALEVLDEVERLTQHNRRLRDVVTREVDSIHGDY